MWVDGVVFALVLLCFLEGVASFARGWLFWTFVTDRLKQPASPGASRVCVLMPVRGRDAGLLENLNAWLGQDYGNYRLIIASDDYSLRSQLKATAFPPPVSLHICEAILLPDCSAKISGLLASLQDLADEDEILVFADSDTRPDRHCLSALVAALIARPSGVTTGYRWYLPDGWHVPTLLRSIWNAGTLTLLGSNERTNFAWGGASAIRRRDFETLDIAGRWRRALSDDYVVTAAAQEAGQGVEFVPQCLVPSQGRCGWSELLDWTTRQIQMTRLYSAPLWRLALVFQTLFVVAFYGGAGHLLWHGLRNPILGWTALLLVLAYGLSCAKAELRRRAVVAMRSDWYTVLRTFRWPYTLLAPAAGLIS
ncbi:MAG: glycosyltransferase [Acidobacteriota bacterium]